MKNIITVLMTLVFSIIFSQNDEINKIIPLSPNAAAFAKYGEIPISNFTGTANVSVPIYNIKTKEFNLPIELSYHTGGNKVEDIASWVGLGWSLITIPMISRSVKGIPDENTGGFMSKYSGYSTKELYELPIKDLRRARFFDALKEGTADSEPDIFNFSILGKSGKFIYDQEHDKFVTLEESQIKISYSNGFFTIISEDGVEYFFSEKEITFSNNEENATGWYVSKISSPNKKEEILFEYDLEVQVFKTLTPKTKLIFTGGIPGDTNSITGGAEMTINTMHTNLLKKISFNEGVVEFNRNINERLDLQGGHSLHNIKVKNLKGEEVYNYDFDYKYISGSSCYANEKYSNKWMLLEKFRNTSSSSKLIEYSFSYDESSIPPCRTSAAQDYWGYFNGANSNSNLIPTVSYNSLQITGANRLVDPYKSQFAVLKKIVYPSGGYTEFDFENNMSSSTKLPNVYLDDSASIDGSSTIGLESYYETDFTINNPPDNFLNGGNSLGGSYADFAMGCDGYELKNGIADANVNFLLIREASATSPQYAFYISRIYKGYLQNGNYKLMASINTSLEGDSAVKSFFVMVNWKKKNPDTAPRITNRFIGGLRVKEIRSYEGLLSSPLIKRYKYTIDYNSELSSGKVFNEPKFVFEDDIVLGANFCQGGICAGSYHRLKSYSNVQQISYSGSYVGYETVIEESNDSDKTGVTIYKYSHSMDTVDDRFPFPPPTSMELYRGQPKEILYYKKNGGLLNLVEKKEFEYNAPLTNAQRSLFKNIFAFKIGKFGYFDNPVDFSNSYRAAEYDITTNINLPASETTTTYFSSGNLMTKKTFFYQGTNHFLITSQGLTNSKLETIETKYFYPHDPQMASEPFAIDLVNKNIIGTPLDTQTFNGANMLSEKKVVYDKSVATSNLLLPKSIFKNKGTVGISETDKKITFDQYDDIGNILQYTQEGATPVSIIWGYNKTQPIAKIENANYSEVSSYVANLQNLSNTGTETSLINALNTLRTSLPNAMVTTYTYLPLIGVSTITDPKGDKIKYEYDSLNRLQFVKDAQGNLLTENQYNYKN